MIVSAQLLMMHKRGDNMYYAGYGYIDADVAVLRLQANVIIGLTIGLHMIAWLYQRGMYCLFWTVHRIKL